MQLVLRQLARLADEAECRKVTGTERAVAWIQRAKSAQSLSTS